MKQDYLDIIADLTQDTDSVLTSTVIGRALDLAVERYSADKPRKVVEDFTASASSSRIDPPAGFVPDTSELLALEYPVDEQPPVYIRASEYRTSLASYLDLEVTVTSGDSLRATYTLTHTLSDVEDTIPLKHREAVANYAASLTCRQLSAHYAHDVDTTIGADSVDHQSKSDRFNRLANQYEGAYFESLGIPKERSQPAAEFVDLDLTLTGGGDRIFHKGRYR